MYRFILMALLTFNVLHAKEPVVDATTPQTMKYSLNVVKENLPETQQELLVLGMRHIVFYKMETIEVGNLKGAEALQYRFKVLNDFLYKELDGKTGREIIDFAATLK